jgi:hypothetical protein
MQTTNQSDSRKLFEFIAATNLEPDSLYTLDQLSAVIEKPIRQHRTPIYAATRLLEQHHHRTLICIHNVGYRVARANEVRDIADNRTRRAAKQVRRGIHTASHTDVSTLTPEERSELDQTRAGLLALERQMTQMRRRVGQIETRVEHVETSHSDRLQRLEDELLALRGEREAA